MRVRSRLSERHWKKRHESAAAQRSSKNGRLLVLLAPERSLLTRKRRSSPFRHDLGPGYYDTHYRLPTRQIGWPTSGCNQQDPWKASERLVSRKPASMVPNVPGSELQIRHIVIKPFLFRLSLTANPCGAEKSCAALVCRQHIKANSYKENVSK